MSRLPTAASQFALAVGLALLAPSGPHAGAQPKKQKTEPEQAAAAVSFTDKTLKLEVWASEPLLANPVCFTFDEKGRCFVCETFRHTQGVPDVRGKPYTDDDIACRTVADRLAMYKKYKVPAHPENSERLRLVWDSSGEGKADKASVFADGFNRPEDGIGAGVLARKGTVYFACIPDLYLLRDTKGENKATDKRSLASGFGIHVQYIGHDLHGLRMGPDGKLYMSVGDRGLNVVTKEKRHLFNPDSGAVLRCDPDGSNLEIVHRGLRNPQELAFDDHGNLFTWDNNSDSGDRARWVQIVEGGDSGWRCGYQHGTAYHTPSVPQGNRGPWNTEKLWVPQWDGQPAYIVPPIMNFGDGPAGITHYPGIGLSDRYKDHFFLSDFRGSPNGSKIWTLAVKPKGASFEIVGEPKVFASNMLPTDCEFGPDGAFYWSDWTTGWDRPGKGRIFRVTDPEAMKNPLVAEAQKLLAEGVENKTSEELAKLLEHPHQQVRQEAQFALASRASNAGGNETAEFPLLAKVAKTSGSRVARLHAMWALSARWGYSSGTSRDTMVELIADKDAEIRVAAAKELGNNATRATALGAEEHRHTARVPLRKAMLTDSDARVRATAAIAYGKVGPTIPVVTPFVELEFFTPLFDVLKANDDKDPYLRHAAVMGLYLATDNPLDLWNVWQQAVKQARQKYDVASVRMGLALALRKHGSDKVAEFLNDAEPRIVAEAARAIYDDRLKGALPALAKVTEKPGQPDAVAFRALAACLWLNTPEPVARFAARQTEPDHTRGFALKLLADWANPGRRDPITGLTMDLGKREGKAAAEALKTSGPGVFVGSEVVRKEATAAVSKLGIKEFGPAMAALVKDAKNPVSVRVDALYAVEALRDPVTKELAALALKSDEPKLRAAGRAVKAKAEPAAVLAEIPALLKDEKASLAEKQGALAILGQSKPSNEVDLLLGEWMAAVFTKEAPPELVLDILEAVETRPSIKKMVEVYRNRQAAKGKDPLAPWAESLTGGDPDRGRAIFLNNSAVYCQRCHKLDGQGGDVGPQLNGIAADKEKDRLYLLESIVQPSAKIAKGFDTVILVTTDERTLTGIIKTEDKKEIRLVTPENKEIVVPVKDVDSRRTGPSAMPADLHTKLSRRELRDVVEFLTSLKEPVKK